MADKSRKKDPTEICRKQKCTRVRCSRKRRGEVYHVPNAKCSKPITTEKSIIFCVGT